MAWAGTDPNAYNVGAQGYLQYAEGERRRKQMLDEIAARQKGALEEFIAKLSAEEPYKVAGEERAAKRQEDNLRLTDVLRREAETEREQRAETKETGKRQRVAEGLNEMIAGQPEYGRRLGLERQTQIPVPEAGYAGETGMKKLGERDVEVMGPLIDDVMKQMSGEKAAQLKRQQGAKDLSPLVETLTRQAAETQDPEERRALEQMLAAAKSGDPTTFGATAGVLKTERTAATNMQRTQMQVEQATKAAMDANRTRMQITQIMANVRQTGISVQGAAALLTDARQQINQLEQHIAGIDTKFGLITGALPDDSPIKQSLTATRNTLIAERDALIASSQGIYQFLATQVGSGPPVPTSPPGGSTTSKAPGAQGTQWEMPNDGKPGNTLYTLDKQTGKVFAWPPSGGRPQPAPPGHAVLGIKPLKPGEQVK
jgi:hypothetical protein